MAVLQTSLKCIRSSRRRRDCAFAYVTQDAFGISRFTRRECGGLAIEPNKALAGFQYQFLSST